MIRTVLVTGAAQGIGRAIAIRLAKDGFNVAVNDIEANSSKLQKSQQEIEQIGQKSISIIADVSINESVEKMMQEVAQKLGSLDVLVANAGIGDSKLLLDTTVEDWDRVFAVNMRGVFLCYKEAAKIMIKQSTGGKIIGACSNAGYRPTPTIGAYSATKWSVRGLTQAAAIEWAPYNITVNTYCPGITMTSLGETLLEGLANFHGKTKDDVTEDFVKATPLGRIGDPDDVANLAKNTTPNSHTDSTSDNNIITWIIVGNIQSGCCRVGDRCLIMPNRTFVEVTNIYDDLIPLLRLYLTRDIAVAKVQLKQLLKLIDHETGEITEEYPRFIKQGQAAIARLKLSQCRQVVCMETFKDYP
ncbi:unnamed protein product [Rotaria sp. Silwood1]|nr:unnamed protein product [Rotaria sp. Silwood1]CAF1634935.1 unnamed protein product [Rotaria sp. Silwood1]